MIGYLKGTIADNREKALLLVAGGVGYRIQVTADLASGYKTGEEAELFIHTAVREDDISLYGFSRKEELSFFEQLLGVSGVGPKMALEILSVPLHLTQNAIAAGDPALLTEVKGLGKRTAERVILELKGKVVPLELTPSPASHAKEDAIAALEGLGYERSHVIRIISAIPAQISETEDVVKYFLKTAA